jgi:hypothetical protein
MDVSLERLEERITEHIIHKRTSASFRQQLGSRDDDMSIERENARDAAVD